jgi:hypothetical protein
VQWALLRAQPEEGVAFLRMDFWLDGAHELDSSAGANVSWKPLISAWGSEQGMCVWGGSEPQRALINDRSITHSEHQNGPVSVCIQPIISLLIGCPRRGPEA